MVDRPNLGFERPLCSKDHHNNLHDRTRTVAWGKNYEQRHRSHIPHFKLYLITPENAVYSGFQPNEVQTNLFPVPCSLP
ncbi:MAG: hypothetical protein EAZ87_07755 [Nostocales cyanobacterium]|nr:MAG: hypothetical protein EAZ87_07755 [Nostocales cyanobacterium]